MCGICGILERDVAKAVSRDVLRRMVARLRHRGPDDAGTFVRGERPGSPEVRPEGPRNLGLGMARLAVIDVLGGRQPMSNEDGSVWVVFNGEVYNFRELRRALRARGHRFRSQADTEVLVHLYEEEGERLVNRLRGMFAFALWDEPRGRLVLARDRLGQKPLVYYDDGARLVFASELQALLEAPGIPRRLSPVALDLYLTYQYIPAPHTIFEGVLKLPPAHILVVDAGGKRLESYWEPPREVRPMGEAEAGSSLRERLDEAVRMRLVSDVPLGAFLSGGVDSSITVALMSRHSHEPVKTFSIGFGQRAYDELRYARAVAETFETEHREFTVEPDAVSLLPRLVRHYGEPFADSSAIPTFYLAQRTREHVTVALSGDGGDEAFGGYDRYRAMRLGEMFDRLPLLVRRAVLAGPGRLLRTLSTSEPRTLRRRLRRFAEALALPRGERYLEWVAYFREAERLALYSDRFREKLRGERPQDYLVEEFARVGRLDAAAATAMVDATTYLANDILVKVDVASMANSLEVRSPFLDHEVFAFGLSLPTRLKLSVFSRAGKILLRRAFADLLPPRILRRRKMGFGVPMAAWLRGPLREHLRGTLLASDCPERGYFRPETIRRLVEEHLARRADHADRLWALLVFEQWHREFLG